MTRTAAAAVACAAVCAAMAGQGRAAGVEVARATAKVASHELAPKVTHPALPAKAVHPAPSSNTSTPPPRSNALRATPAPRAASPASRPKTIVSPAKRPQAGSASRAPSSSAATRPRAAPLLAYASRPEVQAYIDDLVAHEHFDRDALLRLFSDAHYSDTAARLMAPSPAAGVRRDWNAYRARFIDPIRLDAGYRFWDLNADTLARAEREFGVPAEIIVGIVGIETVYGRNTGTFRVIDVLSTLAFDFPASPGRDRSAFFREQLTDALAMDRDGTADLASLRGSYAGAIGMPQFMPGSIRRYAVDYDRNGRIDLAGSPADVIGSVANFLVQQGWVRDLPTHVVLTHPAPVDAAQAVRIDAMVDAGSMPSFELSDFAAVGFVADASVLALPPTATFALIDLPTGNDATGAPSTGYIAGTQNFHVITRYNRSYFYAMSVIELGSTVRALREAKR